MSKKKASGCSFPAICAVVIFLSICVIVSTFSKDKEKPTKVEWTSSEITINSEAYVPSLHLKVSGKNDVDEIESSEIEISANDICKIEYDSSNYAYAIYKITPIKNGKAKITATYDGITSEPVEITIDINEKTESMTTTTIPKTTTTTTTQKTTTVTTPNTDAQEILVYVTPSGDKYHNKHCRYYSDNCTEMTKDQAEQSGYEACKVCGG